MGGEEGVDSRLKGWWEALKRDLEGERLNSHPWQLSLTAVGTEWKWNTTAVTGLHSTANGHVSPLVHLS